MNGNFYQNPTFPGVTNNNSTPLKGYETTIEEVIPQQDYNNSSLNMEQSYIENILRLNKGKRVSAYVSFPDSTQWKDKIFTGIIQEAGRDHLIISDPQNGHWYLILMIYLNYVEFDERINYSHSYSSKTF